VRLVELAEAEGGRWTPRTPAGRVVYAPPSVSEFGAGEADGGAAVRAYFAGMANEDFAEEGTAWLPAGRVYGDGVVLSADGRLLARDAAPDFGKLFEQHWLLRHDRLRAPVAAPAGPLAVVAAHLGRGYGHWLLDELPRLLALHAAGDLADAATILAHAGSEPAVTSFGRLGIAGRALAAGRATFFAAGPLIVPSYVGRPGFPRPEGLAALRDFAAGLGRDTAGAGEKIYVSRAGARRRRVVGEEALRAALEARGFATVRLEERSWAEQIALFRAARVVVAPHGAGLANLVFCAPGTRVVELFARDYVNPCYWRVAALSGLDYRPVVAAGPGAPREERTVNGTDIAVAVGAVLAAAG
jgi:capsular polysaccharide biosynthesis protein